MDAILTMFNTVSECDAIQTALQGLPGGIASVPALVSIRSG